MLSTYWRNKVMQEMYIDNSDVTFYVGLSSTLPTENGANVTEPNGGNYTRMEITEFTSPANGVITNANNISFPLSTTEWFPETKKAAYYVIFDSLNTDGHVLGSGALYAPMAVADNTTVTIAAGLLSISLRDGDEVRNNP